SFTWTRSLTNSQTFIDVQSADHTRKIKNPAASARTDIRANYWSLLAGPSWRVNQYMSLYAMAGMGVAKVSADLKIKDNINSSGGFSESNSTKKNSLAWAAGAQFNLNESVTLDVAYEGSGSGDWRTSGITAGIGLKF
ncbi:Ail/Lom family outer membrane beta-barrel protein, partial [Escherichia coli]|nr:Ail/Lom family outer membrane beta-barrel protein [Escherichia coli]